MIEHHHDIMMTIVHLGHIHRRTAQEMMEQYSISWGQPPILRYLNNNDGCIQRDLAENCHVKAATISSVLDNMEQSGYIERRSQKGDRRVQRVFLTDLGREKHELAYRVFQQLQQECLDGIAPEELDQFKTTLRRILENLQKTSGGPPPRHKARPPHHHHGERED